MDVHLSDGQLLSAVLAAAVPLVGEMARSCWRSRRGRKRSSDLAEVVSALPAGSHAEEVRPDGTVVRVDLPLPQTPSER
jgi:hypothetical protein